MYTPEQYHEIMAKDRQGILKMIEAAGYISLLPTEKQGKNLIGTAANNRAICLAWGDEVEGRVTMEMLDQAYDEIINSELTIPFLFYCRTCLVVAPHLFECMQIPYTFELNQLLPTLRTLNLQGRPRLARRN